VLYVTPSLLVCIRFVLDDVVIVGLNNGLAAVDLRVPVRSNAGIPLLMRDRLIDGLELTRMLGPGHKVAISDGSLQLALAARSAVVYRARPPVQPGIAPHASPLPKRKSEESLGE